MTIITSTELKMNLNKYLTMAAEEDVYVTQYGKIIAKLTNPCPDKRKIAESLFGTLSQDGITPEEAIDERLSKV